MNNNKNIISLIIFFSLCINQNLPVNSESINQFNTFNNRFNLNQSFSLSMSSLNGIQQTNSIFTNNLNYKFSERLTANTNIHIISPMNNGSMNTSNFDMKYDLLLDYKISDNIQFKLKMTNLNVYNNLYKMRFSTFDE